MVFINAENVIKILIGVKVKVQHQLMALFANVINVTMTQ